MVFEGGEMLVNGLPGMKMLFRGIEREEDAEWMCWTRALGDAADAGLTQTEGPI